jgi:hypothetical protein
MEPQFLPYYHRLTAAMILRDWWQIILVDARTLISGEQNVVGCCREPSCQPARFIRKPRRVAILVDRFGPRPHRAMLGHSG